MYDELQYKLKHGENMTYWVKYRAKKKYETHRDPMKKKVIIIIYDVRLQWL